MSAVDSPIDLCQKFYRDHSDLISTGINFTLNTTLLVCRLIPQIPDVITKTAFTAYNITGLISLNIQVRDLTKSVKDLIHAASVRDGEGIFFTAAKVAVKGINIILTCIMFIASVISLVGYPPLSLAMYGIMQPFSLFSLATGIGTDIYDHEKGLVLSEKLSHLLDDEKNDEKIIKISNAFKEIMMTNRCHGNDEEATLARHLFWSLDHYAIDLIKESKNHDESTNENRRLLQAINNQLSSKTSYTRNNIGLVGIGYLGMAVCKAWPGTLVQSAVTWGISSLYAANLIDRKFNISPAIVP